MCKGPLRKPWSLQPNGDLIRHIMVFILSKTPVSLKFAKVKGHARDSDVRAGSVQPIDKRGNDCADQLAVAGAEMHAPSRDLVNKCERRATAAHAAHSMMLRILKARRKSEKGIQGTNEEDILQDLGDDPWTMDVPLCIAHPRSGEG